MAEAELCPRAAAGLSVAAGLPVPGSVAGTWVLQVSRVSKVSRVSRVLGVTGVPGLPGLRPEVCDTGSITFAKRARSISFVVGGSNDSTNGSSVVAERSCRARRRVRTGSS